MSYQFDFTSVMNRRGKDAIAVDLVGSQYPAPREGFDVIPMWVADMNFPVPRSIQDAIIRRTEHPAFGYFSPSDAWYNAIISWQEERNHVTGLTRDCIAYENGVLGGVVSALNVFCSKGDPVLLHSPTYIGFSHALGDNGYRIVLSPLVQDSQGIYRMNLADMERKLKEEHIHAAVLCSPHNPTGRVWEREELQAVMELYRKYDVMVVSDEIWSDLILPGAHHIPTQSISPDARQRTAAFYAPSKTFNLAGLVGSYHIVYNKTLQDRIARESALSHYNSMNVLSMHALTGAFSAEGAAWLEELLQVLSGNVDFACRFIAEHFPGVSVSRPQGTYMLFLDCTQWCAAHGCTIDEVLRAGWDVGVVWQDGRPFHGPCHIRMNLALPLSRVQEAFARLQKHVFS